MSASGAGDRKPTPPANAVAIVGMSGRFPGARNLEQFWRNLETGVESISRFTEAQLEDAFDAEVRRAPNFVRARPILEEVEQFDAEFFGMYAREAELTDPQQRLFLECAWEALENAGCDPRRYRGAIGVFAGCSINTYFLHHVCADRRTLEEFTSSYQVGCYPMLLGAGLDFLATRVSYKLDLRGPSIDLQAACSTSLLAVAQACQSLLLYQADMALAGGVSISFPQRRGYLHQEGAMVSSDGSCRPFDAKASGTVFGSGAGVVALKRLEEALADGDHIYAVIRGCGVNNDGAAKVGFTAPSIEGQAAAIELALANAGVEPSSVSYVECHGTATPLGDPIEVAALTQAFGASPARESCALGSVKSNVGHLDAAAGVVGLIKTALALERSVMPATLHFQRANPQIDFAATPFYVNAQRRAWPRTARPRRAGVSAFGVGGTNVHVVLEEAPEPASAPEAGGAQLLIVSARTATALETARSNLAAHIRAHPDQELADVAFSQQSGRRAFEERTFVVARSAAEAATRLAAATPPAHRARAREQRPGVAFMFPGQGAQYPQMARDLYRGSEEFRRHFDRCAALAAPLMGVDLTELVYPRADSPEAAARLTATAVAQPAIFAVEYALAKLWMSLGIEPQAMIGHSIGEFVAAVLAGVFSLEDAVPLVALRGRLMQELPTGSMLAVRLPERELRPLLAKDTDLAASNAPSLSVASGPEAAIAALEQRLQQSGHVSRRLQTSHAFHSAMVDPIIEPLRRHLAKLTLSAPKLPYVSCVTGSWIGEAEATSPEYWARHARETVRFADALATLAAGERPPVLLEVGPGNVLSTLALQGLKGRAVPVVSSLPDAARDSPDDERMLEALGRLWLLGAEPSWQALYAGSRQRVPLPSYPFERRRFWIEAPAPAARAQPQPETKAVEVELPKVPARPAAAGADRSAEMSTLIAGVLEQLSGSTPASTGAAITFLEMGYDSLFLTQVAQKIHSQTKIKLTFRQLLGEYATIPALAGFLARQLPGAGPAAAAPAEAPASEAGAAARPSRFAVFAPRQAAGGPLLTGAQQQHLDELIARYTQRTAGSKRYTEAHRAVLADPRAVSGFRAEWKELIYPIVVERSAGSKLWDVDGNEYVDLVNGFGGTAFGHGPGFVLDAVRAQLERGFPIGPQADLAGEVAELVKELTGNERATFCNTGSEAVMAAMRVARTVTGRDKIVVFNGDYHGQFDEVLVKGVQHEGAAPRSVPVAPGIPSAAVQNMIVLDYATPATLQWLREHAEELAAVVVEPVQSRHPGLQPFEFLREIRAITAQAGSAFVLDEVVTGFRAHPGGIQALAGVRADLVTYGKVVGGGLPIGILAGSAKFMDALDGGHWRFGDASVPEAGVTFFAGTFVRHPLVLAAARSVLLHLKSAGPQLQESLAQRTAALVAELNQLFAGSGIRAPVETFSSWFFFNIHNEHPLATLLFYHLRLRGIHIQDGFPCFLTTAHSDADIRQIFEAFRDSIAELSAAGILGRVTAAGAAAAAPSAAVPAAANGIPLTESQTEIWLAAQMGDEASCAFNESVSLELRGSLNETALREALTLLFARHDALRAHFSPTGEEMHFGEPRPVPLPLSDVAGSADPGAALGALVAADARTPFDLVNGPPARVQLLRLAADHHVLMFTAHHIVCDGWSINIVVSELAECYRQLCRGLQPQLPPALQFSTYARAEAQRDPAASAQTESYWLERFRDPVTPLTLPTDRPRPPLRSFSGASRFRRIDAELYRAVKQSGAKSGNTLFVTLLGAFQALIGRLCGQDEVVVGVPTAGQSLLEADVLVGHCVNFLPIRSRWNDATPMSEHLRAVGRAVLDASEHSSYTLGTLVRRLGKPREPNRVPLAEIQFNLERLAERLDLEGLKVEVTPNSKAHVVFDLFLNVIESEAGLRLDCDYNTDLFDAATIDRWLDCYQRLLESLVADATQPLSRIEYLPEPERRRLLLEYNSTAADFPRELCIHQLIAASAAEHPERIALEYGTERLTYRALEQRANRLAALLLERLGAGVPGRRVAVATERSADTLVALLAVLKAGCAYVTLEPSHPPARLRHIAQDAGLAALITDGSLDASVMAHGAPVVDVRRDKRALEAMPATAPRVTLSPDDLAYVMYTSGSTGVPKGVEVTHRSVVNLLSAMARAPGLASTDVLLAVTTVSFDIAGLELYLPLAVGARVVIAGRDDLGDGFALRTLLERAGATALQATPATWRLLLEAGFRAPPRFRMLCGGEALPRELANQLLAGEGELWNLYGPTETTIWSTCARMSPGEEPVTVGRPIANTQLYVLDRNDQPVPEGVPGELHIGGEGVARGYHGQSELTQQRFPRNPFATGRMYRTGDLARWLPGGQLQVLGRTDLQVKLRGFRIELGEIESALRRVPGMSEAAVLLREDVPGNPRLVGYYSAAPGTPVDEATLGAALERQIPEYMIPTAWVSLAHLPQSPHGKLDRAALPKPELAAVPAEEFTPAATPTEICLARIWAEVLHLPRVGANMDLLRLGADSIQLFQIIARSTREGFRLTARQLLQQRTLRAVAAHVDQAASSASPGDARAPLPALGDFQRSRRSASTTKR